MNNDSEKENDLNRIAERAFDLGNYDFLEDRKKRIQEIFDEYGIGNFYVSYSGGKDSVVLSELIDMAVPGNNIPRVFMHTGIELDSVVDFVKRKAQKDHRIHLIRPQKNIKAILQQYGYPFKSKEHSFKVRAFRKLGHAEWLDDYIYQRKGRFSCPKALMYQFDDDYSGIKISERCCKELKERPLREWSKKMNFIIPILGLRRAEGGRRNRVQCTILSNNKLKSFHPLAKADDNFMDWMVRKFNIELPSVYYPPYNFKRTGCKGCPFIPNLQYELDVLEKYFPEERAQCEKIWGPVYDEYRRIGYRLKPIAGGNNNNADS